jgi:hypothetical protein
MIMVFNTDAPYATGEYKNPLWISGPGIEKSEGGPGFLGQLDGGSLVEAVVKALNIAWDQGRTHGRHEGGALARAEIRATLGIPESDDFD